MLQTGQRTEQLDSNWVSCERNPIPSHEIRFQPWRRLGVLRQSCESRRQKSSNGFAQQIEPRLPQVQCPHLDFMSKAREVCPRKEILKLGYWRRYPSHDLIATNS